MDRSLQDTRISLHTPIIGRDGSEITEIAVPKGTTTVVAILAANVNPDLWGPDAAEWKPERWLGELPSAIGQAKMPGIYSHLMTFLGGGRSCM
jgi:cytochrome P450